MSRDPSRNFGSDKSTEEILIDLILSHPQRKLAAFFRQHNLSVQGSKAKHRAEMLSQMEDGTLKLTVVVNLLNELDGWGNQHIYFYRPPASEATKWNSDSKIQARLNHLSLINIFNKESRCSKKVGLLRREVKWNE